MGELLTLPFCAVMAFRCRLLVILAGTSTCFVLLTYRNTCKRFKYAELHL